MRIVHGVRFRTIMPKSKNNSTASAGAIALTVGFALIGLLAAALAAAIYARGLYQDGAYYTLRVAEGEWFYLHDPARTVVQSLRQAPIVALSRFSELTLFARAQVFTFVMLALPIAFTAACWFIAPRDQKGWALLPVLHLLLGFSTTSFEAVGEAAVAAAYVWVLIFLLAFRTRTLASQLMFLALAVWTGKLHEGIILCMPLLIIICISRAAAAKTWTERLFLVASIAVFSAAAVYQVCWIVFPRVPSAPQSAAHAVMAFEFLTFEGRWNLPVVAAALALVALALIQAVGKSGRSTILVTSAFIVGCATIVALALFVDAAIAPRAQAQARFNPVFATVLLGSVLAWSLRRGVAQPVTVAPAVLVVTTVLAVTQVTSDFVATRFWSEYIRDFRERAANATGSIEWSRAAATGDPVRDHIWDVITIDWTLPIMSIIMAPNGNVKAIFDYPPATSFRPFNPGNPDELPVVRGVSYESYRRTLRSDQ